MPVHLREWQPADIPCMRQMLYEAVFWRAGDHGPSLEEGLADPEVSKSLADWGKGAGVVSTFASSAPSTTPGATRTIATCPTMSSAGLSRAPDVACTPRTALRTNHLT